MTGANTRMKRLTAKKILIPLMILLGVFSLMIISILSYRKNTTPAGKNPTFSLADIYVDSSVSFDGRFVAYSYPTEILGDNRLKYDIFLYDRKEKTNTRISENSEGAPGNRTSVSPHISGNGRFVVFESDSDNLVDNDTNNRIDIFVFDNTKGNLKIISTSNDNTPANGDSGCPCIDFEGFVVGFTSKADNLVPDDTNGLKDVFVKNLKTGIVQRASLADDGGEAWALEVGNASDDVSISYDGSLVAFSSTAHNLVPGDYNDKSDVFVRNVTRGTTRRVSVSSNKEEANGYSHSPSISGNGRFVCFDSYASNLVPKDDNGQFDVFLHDLKTGKTKLISKSSQGIISDDESQCPCISGDGRFIAYSSLADNLVEENTGGLNIYLYDINTDKTILISTNDDSNPDSVFYSGNPAISGNGKVVSFYNSRGNPKKSGAGKSWKIKYAVREKSQLKLYEVPVTEQLLSSEVRKDTK